VSVQPQLMINWVNWFNPSLNDPIGWPIDPLVQPGAPSGKFS